MAELNLRALWQPHEIDAGLVEVRKRAAALDPGRKPKAELAALEKLMETDGGALKALASEELDLQLKQKSIDDKLARINKELYGGKIVNPREVEAFEKEIEALKRQRSANDDRLLELMELIPPARKQVERIERTMESKKQEIAAMHKAALAEKTRLEAEFKVLSERRAPAAAKVPSDLLAKYDAIRKKTDGTGMALIKHKTSCEACGTILPTRTVILAFESKWATCEGCHRILYGVDGVAV